MRQARTSTPGQFRSVVTSVSEDLRPSNPAPPPGTRSFLDRRLGRLRALRERSSQCTMPHRLRIALTGGPCGGKSTLAHELRAADPGARRYLVVSEAAPLLGRAGVKRSAPLLEPAATQLQVALEESCAAAAEPGQVLICERGTLDPLAYWLHDRGREEDFFSLTSLSHDEHLGRYHAVVHLQTAAIGAVAHYRRFPDAPRSETLDEAIALDRLCTTAWSRHPRYVRIENADRDWPAKAQAAHELLAGWLAEFTP